MNDPRHPFPPRGTDLAARIAANPVQQALFAPGGDNSRDHLQVFTTLRPVYHAEMARLGITEPDEAYLFDLITPLVCFLLPRIPGDRPLVIGLAGGPGAGKTTLSRLLARCLPAVAPVATDCLSIAIDDFYRPKEERLRRGFKWRTLPGTHDTERIATFLAALDAPGAAALTVPRYDLGRDCPMADETLPRKPGICVFDGAMVGSRLPGYDVLARRLDLLIFLDLPTPLLKQWRFQRERRLREKSGGTAGFSEAEMQAFWGEALLPSIEKFVAPNAALADLVLNMDAARRVTAARWQARAKDGAGTGHA